MNHKFGIIGSGSWATALAKILTDNKLLVNWWIRAEKTLKYIHQKKHNPDYLSSVYFDTSLLQLSNNIKDVVAASDILVLAVPSAYAESVLQPLKEKDFEGKKIVSAIKGILPGKDILLNEYLHN